jgi:hypothetical protein
MVLLALDEVPGRFDTGPRFGFGRNSLIDSYRFVDRCDLYFIAFLALNKYDLCIYYRPRGWLKGRLKGKYTRQYYDDQREPFK